jgi:XTP/dITP diphosphohydrolase
MKLVISSHNIHKVREFRSILKILKNVDLLSLVDFPDYHPAEESGCCFEEIAIQKALSAAKALGTWALADDSGLVVPGIDGRPGIHSARFAGPNGSDREKRKKLLQEMQHLQDIQDRHAYFECWIALASPEGTLRCVQGICEGTISLEERGNHGFGYDSLFIKHEYGKTFAELDEDVKNRVSHRRKAIDKILPFLESLE